MTDTRTVTVHVTAAHIGNGEPQDCCLCPIALALIDLFKPEWPRLRVAVELRGMNVWPHPDRSPGYWHAGMPDAVTDFIEAFDHGDRRYQLAPFSFTAEFHAALGAAS